MVVDIRAKSDPLRRRLRRLTPGERIEEAVAFINLYHRENRLPEADRAARSREVVAGLKRHGFYRHTPDELAFGARVAWRNHAACIGRLLWKSLEVVDCRAVTDPDAMADQVVRHMRQAHGNGRIRSIISVFAPVEGDDLPPFIESRQIAQYAGYVQPDGGVVGDPQNVEFTRTAIALGWNPPPVPGPFDLLPLIIRDHGGRRLLYRLPDDAIREVPLTHPTRAAFEALGLRWYSVPCVSDMILTIGGIDYPCAPFNGHYMATEIASRNFTDEHRYDLLPALAEAFGVSRADPLWKDEVALELNRAVLHSYRSAGVSIVDHHAASAQYVDFVHAEYAEDRIPSGDWAWIVPPQASSQCPVFHMEMTNLHDVPNYYRSRATDGAALALSRATEQRSRYLVRFDRLKRRWRNWRRMRT